MEPISKEQRLALAKKKLEDYKNRNQKLESPNPSPLNNVRFHSTPFDDPTNGVHGIESQNHPNDSLSRSNISTTESENQGLEGDKFYNDQPKFRKKQEKICDIFSRTSPSPFEIFNDSLSFGLETQISDNPIPPQNQQPEIHPKPIQYNMAEVTQDSLSETITKIISPQEPEKSEGVNGIGKKDSGIQIVVEKISVETQTRERREPKRDSSDIVELLELQLSESKRDNHRLIGRECELVSQLEDTERIIQGLRREISGVKEVTKKEFQPKLSKLIEENEKLKIDLTAKEKQFKEMESAFILVSNAKMDLATQLDNEREIFKSSTSGNEIQFKKEIEELRAENTKLANNLKYADDIRRHLEIQNKKLREEFHVATNSNEGEDVSAISPSHHSEVDHVHHEGCKGEPHTHDHQEAKHEGENCEHNHSTHDHHGHDHHGHDHHDHDHSGHDHHEHDHSGHDHSGHDHHDGHENHHHDHDHHDHEHGDSSGQKRENSMSEMEKTLKRLQWENENFRTELQKLIEADKKLSVIASEATLVKERNEFLENELNRLEHLVIQLQGENDTIGDYVTLYQAQRLALKERAKEKDDEVARICCEREELLRKLSSLHLLLKGVPNRGEEWEENITEILSLLDQLKEEKEKPREEEIQTSPEPPKSVPKEVTPCTHCSGKLLNV